MTSTSLAAESVRAASSRPLACTIGYYLAFVSLGLGAALLGPTLPALAAQTGTDLGAISFLFSASSLGYVLGSIQGGRLFDRVPGHLLLVSLLIVNAALLALVPFLSALWLLALVIFVTGIAHATVDVGGNTLLLWVHGPAVGPFMNALHFFFGLGAFLTPLVVAAALAWSGEVAWAFWALALLALPGAIWLVRLPSPPHQAAARGDPVLPVDGRLVALLTICFVLYVGAEQSMGGWIYSYATALHLAGPVEAAYLTSGFWGALTVGRLISIPVAARLRARAVLLFDLCGSLACVGLMLAFSSSPAVAWVGTLGLGLAMASFFPTLLSFAAHRMPISAAISRWFFAGAGAGGMTLPWLIGQFFAPVGPLSLMALAFGVLFLLLCLLILLIRPTARPGSGKGRVMPA